VSGAIIDELRRQDWASRSVRRVGRKIEQARDRIYLQTGVWAADDEIAAEVGIPVSEMRACADDTQRADLMSLNAPARASDEAVAIEVGDTVESGSQQRDPARMALARERHAAVRSAAAALGER
jgi:RNA polymerase sigma factor FliA